MEIERANVNVNAYAVRQTREHANASFDAARVVKRDYTRDGGET